MTAELPILDRLLDPVRDCLTTEVATRIADLRLDNLTQSRLDELAEKNKEGLLIPREIAEYDAFIRAIDLVAVLQVNSGSIKS